ncbi:MAG TPA: methyltransferase domain-containing protein [Cyclobacteriaceae bacterium]|nr:methyltransferase domain-containing protein [Cyclobacteriaceae bacterium]
MNKTIHRAPDTTRIFDDRTLESDYATLVPILKPGLRVLDVGCGTGAISAGIARRVGQSGRVTGIDNTEHFILSGRETYNAVSNLNLVHADLFEFTVEEKFDLIVAARVLQWLSNPKDALTKIKALLKPGGTVSVLDYDHTALELEPQPPPSMLSFYDAFLRWREHAGMNNRIAKDLADYFSVAGFHSIEVFNADEVYSKGKANFAARAGIWSRVAGMKQISEEGWIDDTERLRAIEDYDRWVETEARSMTMKLNEVRGRV